MFPLPLFPWLLLSLVLSLLLFLLFFQPLLLLLLLLRHFPLLPLQLLLPFLVLFLRLFFSLSSSVDFSPSSSFLPSLSVFSAALQSLPLFSSASTSTPLPSSSSASPASISLVVHHHACILGLSSEYQALVRWFLASGGSGFFGSVSSSFPHWAMDLSSNFTSGSSLFLASLHAPLPPSSFPSLHLGGSVLPPSALVHPTFPPTVSHPLPWFSTLFSPSVSSFLTPVSFPLAPSGFRSPSVAFSAPFPGYAVPSTSSSVPPVPCPLPPPGLSFLLSAPTASFFPSAPRIPPPVSLLGPAVVPGLGVGISPSTSSGDHPFSAFVASAPSASASVLLGPVFAPVSPGFSTAPPPSTSFSAPPPASDPFSNSEDHLPFVDPSVATLPSGAFQAEYCHMVEYILGLFP